MTSVAFDIRFSCREEDTQEQLKKGHHPHLTALSSVLGCQSREDTGSSDRSLSWVFVACGTGLKVDWYLCPGRRKAAMYCESERRKGLLYSRREKVGMAWSTDVGCGHMDMGRTDKGPRPGNFKASRGRGSSS